MRGLPFALAALLSVPAAAVPPLPPPPPPAPPPPPLVIVISVDQLTGDLFDRYRAAFTGGLARLARGSVFRNGYDRPEDGQGFGTMLKRLSPDSLHVVVSGEASAAARNELVDQRWFWTGREFQSDSRRPPLPRTVAQANAGVARLVASPETGLQPPPICQAASNTGTQFTRGAGDYAAFTGSPALDGATLALAAGLIGELNLGRDRAPDVVSVDLASTGNVGSRFGGGPGDGTCVQLLSLDRDLGDFFETLDRSGLYYGVALSGGGSSSQRSRVPILFWRAGMVPTERLEEATTADVTPTLSAMLGIPTPSGGGNCLSGVSTINCPNR